MAKKTMIGWIPGRYKGKLAELKESDFIRSDVFPIYSSKGKKGDWSETDWPPQKVKLSITEID